MRTPRLLAPVAIALALATSACSVAATPLPKAPPAAKVTTAAPPAAQTCTNALQSYAPEGALPSPGAMPAGTSMAAIQKRGRLIAGISADTYLLGSRNPLSGRIEGFDIDVVNKVADAIFGDHDANHLELRVITAADRLPVLQKNEVDIVVRNMTITCDRWKSIAFSEVYYQAGQKILIRKGSDITGRDSLAGKKVCAPLKTTSLDNLVRLAPKAVPVTSANHTGCLVALQQGDAEAITGDDTVLAGLAAQDPYAVVLGEAAFTKEPYGVGIPLKQVDMVQFVNGVLEQMRADGSWARSYATWLAPTLGRNGVQPTPQYGRAT